MSPMPLKSSYLKVVRYYPGSRLLEVQLTGGVFQYTQVPAAVYEQLVAAQSPGSYFDEHIRYRYRHRRLLTV